MRYSSKFNFNLPDGEDTADIEKLTQNFQNIDENIPSNEDLEDKADVSALETKQDKIGDLTSAELQNTLTLDKLTIINGSLRIMNVPAPLNDTNAVNKAYVDTATSGKYEKPTAGIPKTDLDSDVQTSLGKADTALQTSDIDEHYSPQSANAQSGKAVAEAVAPKQDKFRRIAEVEISAENDNTTSSVVISEDINGQPFALKEARVYIYMPADSDMTQDIVSGYFNISQAGLYPWISYGAISFKSKTKATNNLLEIRANGDYPSCCKIYTQALAYTGATENQKLSFGINDATQVTNLSQITAFNIQLNGSYWRTGAKIIIEGIDK